MLAYITRLYEVEQATRDCDAEVRQAKRAEHAAPLLEELGQWLEAETFLPKSLIGKAATYTRNQWDALNRYLEDGDLSIDNNFAERAMRPIAIGRRELAVCRQRAGRASRRDPDIAGRQLQSQLSGALGLLERCFHPHGLQAY